MPSIATQITAQGTTLKSSELFSSPGKRTFILSLALVLLTVLAYLPVRSNGFINFDDNHYITENAHVKAGLTWDTVKWAFTTYYAANWHPITWIFHMLDVSLFGMNPSGHHWMNLLFHLANVLLLFGILNRMTRVLYGIHQAYGYLPWTAAELVAIEFGKTMTDVYTVASLLSNFRGAPEGEGSAVPRGGRRFTGNLAIAGTWPPQSPPPAHDDLHEDEVHHVVEPAYAR